MSGDRFSASPADTEALGQELAAALAAGGVVSLEGPLGAGKTLLAKAIFAALGVDPRRVTSPTFTLVNRYRDAGPGPSPALYHIDLYRAETPADIESLGLDEVLESGAVVLVEWGERLMPTFAPPDFRVRIEDLGDEARRIVITPRAAP